MASCLKQVLSGAVLENPVLRIAQASSTILKPQVYDNYLLEIPIPAYIGSKTKTQKKDPRYSVGQSLGRHP